MPLRTQLHSYFRAGVVKNVRRHFIRRRCRRKLSKRAFMFAIIVLTLAFREYSGPFVQNVWIPTLGCYGLALPRERILRPDAKVTSIELGTGSGFCLCEAFWIVNPKNCGHEPVDCVVSCKKLNLQRSSNTSQSRAAKGCSHASQRKDGRPPSCLDTHSLSSTEEKKLFSDLDALTLKHHLRYKAPGSRSTRSDDFVRNGEHMRMKDLRSITRGISGFVESIPTFATFEGRGIAIVGGSKKAYQTSYWVAVLSIHSSPQVEIICLLCLFQDQRTASQ